MRTFIALPVFLIALALATSSALGQERVTFGTDPGPLLQKKIAIWSGNNGASIPPGGIALVHLNEDRVPEVILQLALADGSCPPVSGCTYVVLADLDTGLQEIGRIGALHIRLGGTTDPAHRALLACANPWDDYDCATWSFNQFSGKYEPVSRDQGLPSR